MADITAPFLVHSEIHFTTGVLVLVFNEVMDLTDDSSVNRHQIYLKQASDDRFQLGQDIHTLPSSYKLGLSLSSQFVHGQMINISLTEEMRVSAIGRSGTNGGDEVRLTVEVESGAIKDVSGNNNVLASNFVLHEHG